MFKKLFKISIIILFCFLIFSQFNSIFAFAPKIVNKLNSSFNDIEKWCIKLGDEERIRISKKIIRATLISYALLLAIDLVLAAIKSLVS